MKNLFTFVCVLTATTSAFSQHDHHVDDTKNSHNHLAHMQASRAQNFYIHNLPPPKIDDRNRWFKNED